MNKDDVMKIGMAVGLCFAVYKFVAHPAAKMAAVGVAAVIVAQRAPITGPALAQ